MTLLTREQCARLLRVHKVTLVAWAKRGFGPPFFKIGIGGGHTVRYDKEELVRWLAKFAKNGQLPKDAGDLDLMTTEEVAVFLRVAPITLRTWRSKGQGPPYLKIGSGRSAPVLYFRSAVIEWLRQFSSERSTRV